jgi:predicted NodU family carbamoyl transferase
LTAGVTIEDVDHVGISRDPSAHLHKKVLFAATRAAKQVARGGRGEGERKRRGELLVEVDADDEGSLNASTVTLVDGSSFDFTPSPRHPVSPLPSNGRRSASFRRLRTDLGNAAKVRDLRDELARQLNIPKSNIRAQFHNVEHHRAHLASAFYVSPFEKAALLSIDGFGDFISTMWAVGEGNSIDVLGQVEYPHSTGIVYTATTQFIGFPHYGDEGKVMGLAPYGRPRFINEFREIIRTEENGQFRLNLDYFRHHAEGVDMTWDQGFTGYRSNLLRRVCPNFWSGTPTRISADRSRTRHSRKFAASS